LARGWAISGVSDRTREAALAAADAAGMPVGAWVEQALRRALEAGAEPPAPEGVELGELEAMVQRVVAEELRPVRDALDRLVVPAPAATPSPAGGGSPVGSVCERMRQRRLSR
jgi:hypothetical protein